MADECKQIWGLDKEGEINGLWRGMGVRGLWYTMGELPPFLNSDHVMVVIDMRNRESWLLPLSF